jgi:uncharacterized metal-binding protein
VHGSDDENTVLVIPCSGIGKVHGLIGREAAYAVTDELAPGKTDTLCLALLVKGDTDAMEEVRSHHCITIDGCPKACAQKSVESAGGSPSRALQVTEFLKAHRGAQPGTPALLKEDGWTVAREIAGKATAEVTRLQGEEVAP